MPDTRARISTSRDPSAWPTASMVTGTFCCATFTTVTGIGGGAAPCAEAPSFFPHAETSSREAMAKAIFRLMGIRRNGGKRVVYIRSGTYVTPIHLYAKNEGRRRQDASRDRRRRPRVLRPPRHRGFDPR